ncbi:hypothetical protein BU15DRAFT_72996 [Melanogaster broomeanus]|nr:hypothetical protein BU15DRAFT_72996 [Melanogaster broomeanus]
MFEGEVDNRTLLRVGRGSLSPTEETSLLGIASVQSVSRDKDADPVVDSERVFELPEYAPPQPSGSRRPFFASVMGVATMLTSRKTTTASVLCFVLHAFLLLLHLILLALYAAQVEHRLIIPFGTKSNIASTAITITMQSFITGYAAILVLCTQRLALRRNLCLRQTLTATHDLSASWTDLGAALVSLWRQRYVRSSVFGTISVALYLGAIAVLHVTTSTLLSLQSFNGTETVPVSTSPAMSDLSGTDVGAYNWADASSVMRLLDRLPDMTVVGLANNTLYDVLSDTSGMGNTTVNATTFEVTCGSLVDARYSGYYSDGSVEVTASCGGNETLSMLLVPMYKNSVQVLNVAFTSGLAPSLGPHIVLASTFPVLDSAGNLGSNTQTTIWDTANRNTGGDPSVDWWVTAFMEAEQSANQTSFYNPVAGHNQTYYSYTTLYLAELLGLSQDLAAVNQSAVPSPPITLSQLQNALTTVSAATLWTALHLSPVGSGLSNSEAVGWASVEMIVAQSRLNINILPLVFGLCASSLLVVLLVPLTFHPTETDAMHHAATNNLGVLDLLWLANQRPDLRAPVARVKEPSADTLRAAGMIEVRIASGARVNSLDVSDEDKAVTTIIARPGSEVTLHGGEKIN